MDMEGCEFQRVVTMRLASRQGCQRLLAKCVGRMDVEVAGEYKNVGKCLR
jgi:hypothetical protein